MGFDANSREYTVIFKNSVIIYWGGDPVCNCPWPEDAYFLDVYTNKEISFADDKNILSRYYVKQKSFQSSERGGKDIWKLKSAYRNKKFRIDIRYERCKEDIEEEGCLSVVTYNNQLKSIYQLD